VKNLHFLGISLMSNQFFSKRVIRSYARRFSGEDSRFLVVVADSLEAVNYRYINDLSPSEASRKALRVGKGYLAGVSRALLSFPHSRALSASSLESLGEYQSLLRDLRTFFISHSGFSSAIRKEVSANLGTRAESLLSGDPTSISLEEYVLREIALSILIIRMWPNSLVTQVSRTGGLMATLAETHPDLLACAHLNPGRWQYMVWMPTEEDLVHAA
jgi:tRNA-dependent cyclodipeptide synthase